MRGAAWLGSRLAVISFADAPRGKLLAISANGKIDALLAQRYGALQRVAPVKNGFLAVRSWGHWWVEQYDNRARFIRRLPLPDTGIGIGAIASSADSTHALISYSGWTLPSHWAIYDAGTGALDTVFTVKSSADYSHIRVHHLQAVSNDGTRIPVTVLADKRVRPNGHNPTILYGYGGFDIPMAPGFLGEKLAWLERGGVYAVANIRGGNEFGERWHAQGQKLEKQNVFDDFHAAAMALTQSGWTDARHLGIMGGSNGGLLMGTQIVQHPMDYRAVVSMVGIYDMLRHETEFANGRYNVPEYGDVGDAAQFRATLAYSPLQNIKSCTRFPAVLMTTGVNDPRVAPWQSRKFAAALQSACRTGMPILLLTRMHAGHGIGAPFSQRVGNAAIALTFFAQELGLPARPLVRPGRTRHEQQDSLLECIEHETGSEPSHSIIWLHGLGADGNDFVPIVPELVAASWPALRFVFPNAPVQAGHDQRRHAHARLVRHQGPGHRRQAGCRGHSCLRTPGRGPDRARERARRSDRTHPAGRLLAGWRHCAAYRPAPRQRLAGLVVLSSYLPLADRLAAERSAANADVPIFWGHGSVDPVVPLILGERSRNTLRELGYSVDWHTWPMAHQVCMEEIDALRTWLDPILTADPAHASGSPENAGTRQ